MAAEIERIIDRQMIRNRVHYLCVWKGFSEENNTWESRVDLIADGYGSLVRHFEKERKSSPMKSPQASSGRTPSRGRSPSAGRSPSRSRRSKSPGRRRSRSRSNSVSSTSSTRRSRRRSDADAPLTPTRRSSRVLEKYGEYSPPKSISDVLAESLREHNQQQMNAKHAANVSTPPPSRETKPPVVLKYEDDEEQKEEHTSETQTLTLRMPPTRASPRRSPRTVAKAKSPSSASKHSPAPAQTKPRSPSPERRPRSPSPERRPRSPSPTKTTHFQRGQFMEEDDATAAGGLRDALEKMAEGGWLLWLLSVVVVVASLLASRLPEPLGTAGDASGNWRLWLPFLTPLIALLLFFHQKDERLFAKWIAISLGWRCAAELLFLVGATPQEYYNVALGALSVANAALVLTSATILRNGDHTESKTTLLLVLLAKTVIFFSDSMIYLHGNAADPNRVLIMSLAVVSALN
ncbi:TPA: hypothetical protein N0F65_004457 [Lagenidium giganteum]|uniref:Chromo domain-containing protein n=1 Tax=Lagenidium giganteum TaxID=4803 RepID=A0AAV2ZP27_9STRA|nr:TPA: hypothetical protein N0F65_004457 [Lagenidium giganteum]